MRYKGRYNKNNRESKEIVLDIELIEFFLTKYNKDVRQRKVIMRSVEKKQNV